jgi:hypothetical protein
MIRRRIVEINCSFNKAKSENLSVKIEIALRIARDGRDVMNAKKFHGSVIVAAVAAATTESNQPTASLLSRSAFCHVDRSGDICRYSLYFRSLD